MVFPLLSVPSSSPLVCSHLVAHLVGLWVQPLLVVDNSNFSPNCLKRSRLSFSLLLKELRFTLFMQVRNIRTTSSIDHEQLGRGSEVEEGDGI